MSYSSTYRLFKSKVSLINEHHNGWGSGPVVWSYMEKKYLPPVEYSRLHSGNATELWTLWKDTRLLMCERFAMLATYDWSYVETKFLTQAADYADEFYDLSKAKEPNNVNHWDCFAEDYRTASFRPNRNLLGVCIECTSVADLWRGYPKYGKPFGVFEAMGEVTPVS